MKPQSNPSFTAYVGIDWADRKHDFCLQAADSDQREFGTMDHSPEVIAKWAYSLRDRFGGPIAICLELAKGPLVSALQRYEFIVLFPVHPSTLAKYRDAFVPSGAKDDPTDAEMALDILLRHPDKLHPLKLQSVAMRTLTTLVEERRSLVDDGDWHYEQSDQRTQGILSAGAGLVRTPGYVDILRFPEPLANA